MAKAETKIVISGDATGAKKAFGEVSGAVAQAKNKVTEFAQAHKVALAAVAAGLAAGIAGLAAVMMKATKAAMEQEDAEMKLQGAMAATGTYTKKLHQSWVDYAGGLQKVTLFGDDAILSAMGMVQQFGKLDDEGMKKLIPSILDLATAMGVDLETAAKMVGKTLGGTTNALAKQGIEVDMTGTKSEKLADIIEGLNSKFKGQAELMRGTLSGTIAGVKIAYGELWESLGKGITESGTFQTGIAGIEKMLWSLGEIADKSKGLFSSASLQMINFFIQGIWFVAENLLRVKMALAMGEIAWMQFDNAATKAIAHVAANAAKMLPEAMRKGLMGLAEEYKAEGEATDKEIEKKQAAARDLGDLWLGAKKAIDEYGKAIKSIPKETAKKPAGATMPVVVGETTAGAGGKPGAEVKDALAEERRLLDAQRQYDMAGIKDTTALRLQYLNKDLANAKANTAEWYKLMAEKKEIEVRLAQEVSDEKKRIAEKDEADRLAKEEAMENRLIDFNSRFVAITEASVRAARKEHGAFFKEFGKGLAGMVKQYIRAKILEVTATQIAEATKATAAAPLTFGASLAAILPIMVASAAGIAALEAIIPSMADGGIVKASPGGTIVRVAEAGRDEAIVPLGAGVGGTNNYTFNISSHLDLAVVTEAIRRGNPAAINMVKQINRTSGTVGGEA